MKLPRLALGLAMIAWLCVVTPAQSPMQPPRIWDDGQLADWATPIAALNLRPAHWELQLAAGSLASLRTAGTTTSRM